MSIACLDLSGIEGESTARPRDNSGPPKSNRDRIINNSLLWPAMRLSHLPLLLFQVYVSQEKVGVPSYWVHNNKGRLPEFLTASLAFQCVNSCKSPPSKYFLCRIGPVPTKLGPHKMQIPLVLADIDAELARFQPKWAHYGGLNFICALDSCPKTVSRLEIRLSGSDNTVLGRPNRRRPSKRVSSLPASSGIIWIPTKELEART